MGRGWGGWRLLVCMIILSSCFLGLRLIRQETKRDTIVVMIVVRVQG